MLTIDTNFNMYQFTDVNWKNSPINLIRGANSSQLQDILYDNDGRMYGLIFNTQANILQIMKQDSAFYLGNFIALDKQLSSIGDNSNEYKEFVMSDMDILRSKIGDTSVYQKNQSLNDTTDDDTNIAYQKMILQTRSDLKSFCANRSSVNNTDFDNYDLLSQVESNSDKITNLKDIINNLIIYEPDKARIIEKYPIIKS
jgi:hypothetical protein